jgi:hypothetical protein
MKHNSHGNCLIVAKLKTQDYGLAKFWANSCGLSSPTLDVLLKNQNPKFILMNF